MIGQPYFDGIPSFLPTPSFSAMPLSITGGRTFLIDLIVKVDGDIEDITDASFTAQVRKDRSSTNVLAEFDYEILDGPAGSLRLSLSPDETYWVANNMTTGVWDLEIIRNNGDIFTVIPESPVNVRQGVSHFVDEYSFDYGTERITPVKKNFAMFIGDTWTRTLVFKTKQKNPLDKTGCTYRMQLRRSINDPLPALEATFDLTDLVNGKVKISLNTDDALPGRYQFDIEETNADDQVTTIMYGTFKFSKDVTRG